ncbi:hypothetical protein EI42_01091 [Thermosporothrix hazakensis]|jgi:hypothetical protein|uniref:Uncharacterized protein n=1 Tax=Thermosporothrix hazakensis TaxID=644383 RepID=A0A326UEN2_THEHA|nr:hypothetical protein EI42_01091 [Thermosporothrix hazakensis]
MRRRLLYFYSLPLFMLLSLLVACINIFWKIPGSYNPASNQVLYTSPLDPAAIITIVLMGGLFLLCYLKAAPLDVPKPPCVCMGNWLAALLYPERKPPARIVMASYCLYPSDR